MTKLKVCKSHSEAIYTLKDKCPLCAQEAKDAHYKFIKIKSVKDN